MKFLNQLKYRAVFSIIISGIYVLVSNLFTNEFRFDFYTLVAVAVLVYIPVTIIWAIISTFFMDEKDDSDGNALDG